MKQKLTLASRRITPQLGLVTDYRSVTLLQNGDAYRLRVRREVELSGRYQQRQLALERQGVQPQLAIPRQARIPAFPVSAMVCDGAMFELTIHWEYATLRLDRLTAAPAGAAPLAAFAGRRCARLEMVGGSSAAR